jgi:hypothetical protein
MLAADGLKSLLTSGCLRCPEAGAIATMAKNDLESTPPIAGPGAGVFVYCIGGSPA